MSIEKKRIIEQQLRLMFKIVLFLEESEDAWSTPIKLGFLFLNRLLIEEDAGFEVIGRVPRLKMLHCEKSP